MMTIEYFPLLDPAICQRRRAVLTFTAGAVFWHSLLTGPGLLETTRLAAGQVNRAGWQVKCSQGRRVNWC
jgi:hypothetical protein